MLILYSFFSLSYFSALKNNDKPTTTATTSTNTTLLPTIALHDVACILGVTVPPNTNTSNAVPDDYYDSNSDHEYDPNLQDSDDGIHSDVDDEYIFTPRR